MVQFNDVYKPRHWCQHSEPYTGGHSLHSALDEGWQLGQDVTFEEHQLGTRIIRVYHFELSANQQTVTMCVVTNPYVERVIREHHLHIVSVKQQAVAAV